MTNQIPTHTPGPQPERITTYREGGRHYAFIDTGNPGVLRLTLRSGATKQEAIETMLRDAGFCGETKMITSTATLATEIISLRECLERINLGSLMEPHLEEFRVEWSGYPVPFPCSHDAVYGFGPLDRSEANDRRGAGRRYQKPVRVNQYVCGGEVLFSWTRYDREGKYPLNSSCVISIRRTDDSGSACLVLGVTG